MNKKLNENIASYWIESAEIDFHSMKSLFKSKNYVWSLFVGHLVIEKLLKALYIQKNNSQPFFTHDLLRLTSKMDLELTEKQKTALDTILHLT